MRELTTDFAGQIGVEPRIIKLKTTDSFATITTEGYLNSWISQGYSFNKNDIVAAAYGTDAATSQLFTLSFDSDGNITMEAQAGDVVTPVTANHIAVFTSTTGAIGDDATTAINGGNIQAGLSGTAGSLISYPATVTTGSLSLTATANSGDYANVITNAATGQATTWTLANPSGAASKVLQAPGSLVSGNLVKNSGTAGLIADVGASLLAKTTAAYGGGGSSNAFTATGVSASSIVVASIASQTGTASLIKVVPGSNIITATFSADPGASTTLNYIAFSAAI